MELLELIRTSPGWLIGVCLLLGLVVGSFLNVVAHRLPLMMQREWESQCRELLEAPAADDTTPERFNLLTPASRCPHCGHRIRAIENIPVLSWLLLRGRCRECRTAISVKYPLVEAFTGLTAGILAWHFGFGWPLAAALVFTWTLIALSVIDIEHQLLPDSLTLALLWLGLLLSLGHVFVSPEQAIIGAAAGYLSLWIVYQLFRLLTGKEGMGFGDFKLLAACGAWMGWKLLPLIILLSSLVGAVVGVAMILILGRDRQLPIPFGPYIAAAGWIALLWGADLIQGYLRFAGL
ncbi:prepilin peptidase [Thiohalobacter thiocyanaticus]|uniref:Prepilin leader peptidase/N-methyltransferase n=1 Tax=Thiohalobacter thiocyanaticus TaxID=585455 RepID=A0A426QL90_9GAMM|nr:A24 family peptidase [Thiohalobacter thiocyanaticus]RRQ22525.1 prepilin peptidase [Thiohalobacter thiocyanaticus]